MNWPRRLAGTVCAVTGLEKTCSGQGLGAEESGALPLLEPVLTYRIILPPECDVHVMYKKLGQLEEEIPELHLVWSEASQEIHVQVMGEVQMEILQSMILERSEQKYPLIPAASYTKRPLPGRWREWDIMSLSAITRRCICCWSRESGAAACSSPQPAAPTIWI